MIDFHTHILPNMDDGSNSVDTSNKLLDILEKDGVKLVCLTSHFYPMNESIEEYIVRRNKAFKELNYQGNIKLKLGAEIRFYHGISVSEDIGKLVLDGTNTLLIEFPFFAEISKSMIDEIIKIKLDGYDIVLAHIERYHIKDSVLEYLHNCGIKFQMNCECVNGFFSRKKAIKKYIEKHYISYLGSDCHNLENRKPNYKQAIDNIKKELNVEDISFFVSGLYNIL